MLGAITPHEASALVALYLGAALVMHIPLWLLYLAVMALKRARDAGKLHPTVKSLGLVFLIPGYLLDWFLNTFFYSLICLDVQLLGTISSRLKEYNRDYSFAATVRPLAWLERWRLGVCDVIEPLVNPFDPDGTHIGDGL